MLWLLNKTTRESFREKNLPATCPSGVAKKGTSQRGDDRPRPPVRENRHLDVFDNLSGDSITILYECSINRQRS